jgi:hypothetical protein
MMLAMAAINKEMSMQERVDLMAPGLEAWVSEFEAGKNSDGVSTFQEKVRKAIRSAGLSDSRWVDTGRVGVHPANRDFAGLVPVDVHDLLLRIAANGWCWEEVEALACEIPPIGEEGIAWRAYNMQLAATSDGLLAPVNGSLLEIVTGRGSHTTAAVRCMVAGTRGVHEELCIDGVVSRSKICERQPSMGDPISKGICYEVIRWQLVLAVPKLMEVLSRTGNSSHGVARVATILQGCKRVHAIALATTGDIKYDVVAKRASHGMNPEYHATALAMCDFVQTWSGGRDGHVLASLELYERTLSVKRKINPFDLQNLSRLDMATGELYVTAMVKALLNAPGNMVSSDGVASVFGVSDIASLQPKGRNRQNAIEAIKLMQAFSTFLAAYSKCSATELTKLTSDFEVKLVMHVHSKKSDSRLAYTSLEAVALHMYDEAKKVDEHLPDWSVIQALADVRAKKPRVGLRETSAAGVTVSQLKELGFDVGTHIVRIQGDSKVFEVVGFAGKAVEIRHIYSYMYIYVYRDIVI